MSKRDLKKYLNELTKEQLEEQILELYENSVLSKYIITLCLTQRKKRCCRNASLKFRMNIFQYKRLPRSKTKDAVPLPRSTSKHFSTLGVDPL
jgi:hypothetical protein